MWKTVSKVCSVSVDSRLKKRNTCDNLYYTQHGKRH